MKKVLFLVGPTASGKTEYAIRACERFNGEIVSADSMQLYKYLDIGSAKPTSEERKRAVHHLIDTIDPKMPFSVAEYQPLAKAAIRDIMERGKLPIVCGGTGLYVNSLLYKMDFGKSGLSNLREQLFREAEEKGGQAMYERLYATDPETASRIEPQNTRKVIRALELLIATGESLADFSESFRPTEDYETVLIGLNRDRAELVERINRRVELMFRNGLAEEVNFLIRYGLTGDSQAMKAIGYSEILDAYLGLMEDEKGNLLPPGSREAMTRAKELIKIHTRQYAKRQVSWFKRLPGIQWISLTECREPEEFLKVINEKILS